MKVRMLTVGHGQDVLRPTIVLDQVKMVTNMTPGEWPAVRLFPHQYSPSDIVIPVCPGVIWLVDVDTAPVPHLTITILTPSRNLIVDKPVAYCRLAHTQAL